jgi:6,7-dimethyl-8-ribityllumazine synthase
VRTVRGALEGKGLRVGIVVSRFNEAITRSLLSGATETLARLGVEDDDITVVWAPGAFELPFFARLLARAGEVDAVICLGAVIRGATSHYEHICRRAATGIAAVADELGIPVIFGVLTTDTIDQAWERSGTKAGNKGSEAALSAVECANAAADLGKPRT